MAQTLKVICPNTIRMALIVIMKEKPGFNWDNLPKKQKNKLIRNELRTLGQ